jgi:hypothetical protein
MQRIRQFMASNAIFLALQISLRNSMKVSLLDALSLVIANIYNKGYNNVSACTYVMNKPQDIIILPLSGSQALDSFEQMHDRDFLLNAGQKDQ